ncbi:MAG: response regulator, partial [Anaerolineales bacterium]|nr:response regulator [Anaerolineales bacterium]
MAETPTTILYVEDTLENRILVRRVLMAEGYHILEASTAAEAFEILKETSPDLILMDINMPEIDGYTLTGRIKALPGFENIPIIAV